MPWTTCPTRSPRTRSRRRRRSLLAEAADHDAKALRVLGRRLLEVLDPEAAEAEEAAAGCGGGRGEGEGVVHDVG